MYNILEEPAFPNLLAFALIGFFMLLLAFFNYVNLTLARSLDRAKEVGIRKVSGAVKQQLMMQFLSESLLIAFFAFGLAQVQLYFISTLQIVQNLTGTVSQDVRLWIFFILFTVVTGLLAGWIPARVLSSFKPVQVLKGKFNAQLFGGVGLRKTLTVIQFSASLIALITLLVFYQQSLYMAKADYGFNRERLLNIPVQAAAYSKAATALASVAGVEQVGGTSGLFGFSEGDNKFIKREKEADSLSATYFSVTPSFINNMELEFVAGENLPVTNAEKASPFIVLNEEACRRLKFKDSYAAVGKLIWVNDSTNYQVAGVVKDFHFASFLRSIAPLVLRHDPGAFRTLNIKVAAGAEPAIIPQLQTEWKKLYPNQLFESTWYDRQLYQQHLHKDDLLFIGLLTGMALSIACLGLLGMVIYTTKNRLKEVSIRKIMGASAGQIIFKISKEFLGLLGVAIGVGLPAGLFVSVQLLQQYAYRIPVGAEILAGSAAALLGLGVLTIGWHTYRAAIANPVKNLRTE
jgi:putative ABC transport system permease protein